MRGCPRSRSLQALHGEVAAWRVIDLEGGKLADQLPAMSEGPASSPCSITRLSEQASASISCAKLNQVFVIAVKYS